MKRLFIILFLATVFCGVMEAQTITFRFQEETLSDANLREKMEERISSLLSEITKASKANKPLNLDSLYLSPRASKRLSNLWKNMHFSCEDTQIVEKCLCDVNGYEVRDIFITLRPVDKGYSGVLNRKLVVCFDSKGLITGVNMAMEDNMYHNIMNNAGDITDCRRRLEIIKSMEEFRNYFDEKDLEALSIIYSDDYLSFGDDLFNHTKTDVDPKPSKPSKGLFLAEKKQYLRDLTKIFNASKYVKMDFDQIEVRRYISKANFYAVTLHQEWSSTSISNNGYMFIMWEFRDHYPPSIHLRTWQPEIVNGRRLAPEDVLNENDFFIP